MTIAPEITAIMTSHEYGPSPESPAEAQAWLAAQGRRFGLFIDGAWTAPGDGFATRNPATGAELAQITQASAADIDTAVAAARRAQPGWRKLGGHGRAKLLYALARLIQKHARLLAVLETLDNGKPIRESRDIDIPLVIRHFYHHAGWAQLVEREFRDHEPVGVAGQIVPWNFPLLMLAWKIAPALACGNTVVFKPAEFTSLTALAFAELCREAGLPPGVVNIVTGDGAVGAAIVAHPEIDKIAFTGSTEVGRQIRIATAGSGKKLSLELGGKSPFIVFADADLDAAVEGLVDSIWFNQGQVCCAGSRLLVQERVQERFLAKVKARMATLRLGDPMDKSIDIGAIVDPIQRTRIAELVATAEAEGATIWAPPCTLPEQGSFYPPTLITGAGTAATVAQTEIFGPVLVAMSFRTPAEAVQLANNTVYGLAACVWTESISLALDIAPKLKAGVVWVNSANQFDAACGFGGYRESGFGREGGREGLEEYLKLAVPGASAPGTSLPALQSGASRAAGTIDRTAKLYIGGKQARPDGGYSRRILAADGSALGEAPEGNRKDIRNAVEAAVKQEGWAAATAHNRAQVLYYIAENVGARAEEFAARLQRMTGSADAPLEVERSIERLFYYAAWADKYDGRVHNPPVPGVVIAMNEPIGVIGLICPDEAPLLSFLSLAAPALALGNRVVAVPSERHPLIVTELYQVFDTSDLPGGAVNIVTGSAAELARTLAGHAEIDAIWGFGADAAARAEIERLSAGTLKRSWVEDGAARNWLDPLAGEGPEFLRQASQVKNIWVPYGV
ncbi:MAG: aldehyde dehydrogenase family protein [Aliidongia sp.]